MLVPSLVVYLAKAKIVDEYDLSSLRHIFCGAAPLSEETETLVKKRVGVDSIRQAYGLTETTLAVIATPQNRNKSGSAGMLLPGVKCKVNNHLITSETRQD
jgi:acyl-CoA synthetase (AMP-forming)/AMP-acid ligase II